MKKKNLEVLVGFAMRKATSIMNVKKEEKKKERAH
jgi:hypothetical protein